MTPRLLRLMLLAAAINSCFACSRDEPELTVWIGGAVQEVDYWTELIGEFEGRSGLEVRMVRQPTVSDQRRPGLVISLQARQPDPDVFLMDVVWIAQFALSGWLEPFDDYMERSSFSTARFFQRVLNLADYYDGALYALPVYVDGGLLYYRKDLLNEYGYSGAPQTWNELRQMCTKIQPRQRRTNPGFNGFVWMGAQYEGLVCTFLECAASNGGGFLVDGALALNNERNTMALQWMHDAIQRYGISPPNTYTEMREEEVRRAFQQGGALFERNWPYAWKLHQSEDSPVRGKVGIAALPHFDGEESASALGGWHIGISRYSDTKNEAWDFVQFVTSYATQKKLALNLGWNPGRTDVYEDEDILRELPHLAKLRQVFEHAVARPNLPYYTQVSSIIQRYANDCLAGKITPGVALKQMQEEVDWITKIYEE